MQSQRTTRNVNFSIKRRKKSTPSPPLQPTKRVKTEDKKVKDTKIIIRSVFRNKVKIRDVPADIIHELTAEKVDKPEMSIATSSEEEKTNDTGISDYELLRLKNLQDNAEFFASLGIAEMKEDIRKTKPYTLKAKPVKKDKLKAPPEPRRTSLRLAKMDPEGIPLPEDLTKKVEPVEEHPRKPSGPLEMKSYLGFNCDEKEHDDLFSNLKGCFKCKVERNQSSDTSIDSYLKTFCKIKISANRVAKVVPNRIFSVDIHPSNSKVITAAGDKWGFLGLWDVMPERSHQSDGVVVYTPHSRPINCLRFSIYKHHQLFSCSYDGSLRCCDLEKEVFDEIYTTVDEDLLLKDFDLMTADTMLVSQQDGCVAVIDTRTSGCKPENTYLLHSKSLRTVSVHPVQSHILCTSSTDCTVAIWDLRKLKHTGKNKPLDEMIHGKSVNSAYFSPVTGKYILSTSLDDKISIFNSENCTKVKEQHIIRHDNHVGRWLTNFRATWHPVREDLFVVGSMQRPRQIDIYRENGRKALELKDQENLSSVCSLNIIGRSQDVVVGANSSGRLHVFM